MPFILRPNEKRVLQVKPEPQPHEKTARVAMADIYKRESPYGDDFKTTLMTVTQTINQAQETIPPSNYNPNTNNPVGENQSFIDFSNGAKAGTVMGALFFVALIVIAGWFCCCSGRARRRRQLRAGPAPVPNQGTQNLPVPLNTLPAAHLANRNRPMPGDAPPPQYQEVLPPRHQRIAGGVTHVREEEEGIISDGKTPLSEIPFEDVVISSASSAGSSSRNFEQTHHAGGGNTYGHTNS